MDTGNGRDDVDPADSEDPANSEPGADTDAAANQAEDRRPGLEPVDAARISAMCEAIRTTTTEGLLTEVFDGVDGAAKMIDSMGDYCTFDHGALLVFPHNVGDALATLPRLGATPGELMPSVVVRSRLSKRYGIAPELLDVKLTHATLSGTANRMVEVFMLARSPAVPGVLMDRERSLELERHVALRVPRPDPVVIQGVRWLLREQAGFTWDGGGYNPHEDRAAGGTNVLYVLRSTRDAAGILHRRRLEVKFTGNYSQLTRTHVAPEQQHRGQVPKQAPTTAPATASTTAPVPAQATDPA